MGALFERTSLFRYRHGAEASSSQAIIQLVLSFITTLNIERPDLFWYCQARLIPNFQQRNLNLVLTTKYTLRILITYAVGNLAEPNQLRPQAPQAIFRRRDLFRRPRH